MPSATLTDEELFSALTQEQLDAVLSHWPNTGITVTPITQEKVAAIARVNAYAGPFTVAPALLSAWVRDIAVWHILKRLGLDNAGHATAKDTALKELESLKNGEFTGLPRDGSVSAGRVISGGREKVL